MFMTLFLISPIENFEIWANQKGLGFSFSSDFEHPFYLIASRIVNIDFRIFVVAFLQANAILKI